MKKFLLTILLLNFSILGCFSQVRWKNDSREMFQNNELTIYEINLRTFGANDKNDNGIIEPELGETFGNFINAVERLDELEQMGINAIHVMPVTPTGTHRALGTAGSLYAMSDFASINPKLDYPNNEMSVYQEFEYFIEECHKRNIRVIIDLPSCGAYDLFLKHPDIFYTNEKGEPVSPSDWLDVYLFKTQNDDGRLNNELLQLNKDFLHMIMYAKADGLRGDVATIKPYEFWRQLILYARAKDPQFLFLAEASNSWTEPPCKECVFTTYDKLMKAGFDGYYGSYFNFKDWENISDLKNQVKLDTGLSNKYPDKKSVIGSFSTHDELSPILIGGYNYTAQIIWLNALLPLNPYYIDGMQSGDTYIYPYANQKAKKSFTDNDSYYVHKGKMDIFNFSRQPGGEFPQLRKEITLALKFRDYAKDVITKGKFDTVKTNNNDVFAFTRKYNQKTVFVILNKNKTQKINTTVKYKGLFSKNDFVVIKAHSQPKMKKDKIFAELEPSEILILYSDK